MMMLVMKTMMMMTKVVVVVIDDGQLGAAMVVVFKKKWGREEEEEEVKWKRRRNVGVRCGGRTRLVGQLVLQANYKKSDASALAFHLVLLIQLLNSSLVHITRTIKGSDQPKQQFALSLLFKTNQHLTFKKKKKNESLLLDLPGDRVHVRLLCNGWSCHHRRHCWNCQSRCCKFSLSLSLSYFFFFFFFFLTRQTLTLWWRFAGCSNDSDSDCASGQQWQLAGTV